MTNHDDAHDAEPVSTSTRAERRKIKFTPMGLQRLKVPPTGQYAAWDEHTDGLSVLVSYGGSKAFRVSYPLRGKYRFKTIGQFPDMTIEEARDVAREYRKMASNGIDPRTPKPSSTTFGQVVDDFVKLYAKPRQRTWQQTERVLKSVPWLDRSIAEITKKDAYQLLDQFVADGTPYKAAVTLSWCKKLWRWAWERDIVAAPIMDAVKIEFEKRVRDRVYSDAEIKSMWGAADKFDDPAKGAYFKLLLLLAPRKSALAGMRWADIKDDVWVTPFELTKSRKTAKPRTYATPLPPLAVRILAGLPRSSDLVFGNMPMPKQDLAKQFVRHGAPSDFRYHACRHTLATWLQNAGHSMWEISLILNHSTGSGVTAGYSHGSSIKLKLQLLNEWADHVASLVTTEGVALLR